MKMKRAEKIARKKIQKGRILVVEDDLDILESLEVTLRMKGFDVTSYSDTKKVLAAVEANPPDLIVMDVMMPPPDGYELCRRLKADAAAKKIPIVLLSARTHPNAIEMGFQSGADRYLAKPFLNDELVDVIQTLLGGA